jgi:hypothetical protein
MKTIDNDSNQTQCTTALQFPWAGHCSSGNFGCRVSFLLKIAKERQTLYENRASWAQLILFCELTFSTFLNAFDLPLEG